LIVNAKEFLLWSCTCGYVPEYRCGVVDVGCAEMQGTCAWIDVSRLCNQDVQTRVYSRRVLECDLRRGIANPSNQYWNHEDEKFQPFRSHGVCHDRNLFYLGRLCKNIVGDI
jgi:hypothetical protein